MFISDDVAVRSQINTCFDLAGPYENPVQIPAMNHRIRIPKSLAEALGQIDVGDFLCRNCIHEPQLVDEHSDRSRGVTKLELIESVECIWTKLDSSTNFLIASSALKNDDPEAPLRKRERCRQAADSAS